MKRSAAKETQIVVLSRIVLCLGVTLSCSPTPTNSGSDSTGDDAADVVFSADDTEADIADLSEDDMVEEHEISRPEDTAEVDSSGSDNGPDSEDTSPSDSLADPVIIDAALPPVWNYSGSDIDHVSALVKAALNGLGFVAGAPQGPRVEDRIFVGLYYLVWIDQSGFVGKMNGLWRLNGEPGNKLDFVLRDNGRPLNTLIVGELGDGEFSPGYSGGEHIEFPNNTPEINDKSECAQGDWCNQYAHDEAASITDSDIPWWSSCNKGQTSYNTIFTPIEAKVIEGGIRLVWEAPLVKEADGDGNWDGDECHQDWLFPDLIRRPVYLQTGYDLYADKTHLDRVMSFRNPKGNPPFGGPMSAIGGFVFTSWPNPHPAKRLHAWLRPSKSGFDDAAHGILLKADTWNDHQFEAAPGDEVYGWIKNPFTLSTVPKMVAGRSLTISHVGESDNDDLGVCLCSVHGAIEMGGGLLHNGISLPIDGGSASIEARRRLDLPGAPPKFESYLYQAESDLSHSTGKADVDGWAANVDEHEAGHLIFGPYATYWLGHHGSATFTIMIDNNSADDLDVVILDVYDATTNKNLATRTVTRKEFQKINTWQTFDVDFELSGSVGHKMEVRAWWTDNSFMKIDSVLVSIYPSI